MLVKQVVPSLTESINQETGLHRTDPVANIEILADMLYDKADELKDALEMFVDKTQGSPDKWGAVGSLQHTIKLVSEAINFLNGTND